MANPVRLTRITDTFTNDWHIPRAKQRAGMVHVLFIPFHIPFSYGETKDYFSKVLESLGEHFVAFLQDHPYAHLLDIYSLEEKGFCAIMIDENYCGMAEACASS